MDVDEENILTRKCYKLEQPIYDNLKIFYNSSNSMIVLWNSYQIFIYDNFELQSAVKIIPQFLVQRLIATNNHLVCLDKSGGLHTASLKFKNTAHKNVKIPFLQRDVDIKTCINYKQDYVMNLKYEAASYCLYLHSIDSNFTLRKIVILFCREPLQVRQNTKENYILVYHTLDEVSESLKRLFIVESEKISDIVVTTFDNYSVYGFIFSPKMRSDRVTLVKLYSCPAEICNIEIINSGELNLIITLKMGTVIRIMLNNTAKAPDIVHFNTSLHKTLTLKEYLVYTDGSTMWKAENIFGNVKFTQFFVKDTNDFVKCGDLMICTTFTNLLYTFCIEDENALINREVEEYCPAEKLLNNDNIKKIFEEFDKNTELVKKLTAEQDYISALALSNKQNIVEKAIESNIMVYENYEHIDKADLTLTEELKEYFAINTWLFLIKISNSGLFDVLNKILTNLSECIRIYLTLSTNDIILKTTTLNFKEPLKKINVLIPMLMKNYSEIKVNVKIVINIPGTDNANFWTVLYRKDIILNCEHFIKDSNKSTIVCLKNPAESNDELIYKNNLLKYGCNFEFNDNLTKECQMEWSFYVKLPKNYKKLFKNEDYSKKHFNPIKSTYIHEKFSDEEFLNANNSIIIMIGNEKLSIKIQNDGFSDPLLAVTGSNIKMAYNLRNFLSNMIYNNYENPGPEKDFISSNLYTATENLQKAVEDCINRSSYEEFLPILDKFEKHIIGNLPL